MASVLVLTTDPAAPALDAGLLDRVAGACAAGEPKWLAEAEAAELPVDDAPDLLGRVRGLLGGAPVDANVLPAEGRRKRLLLADMDSTIIEQECIDELADLVGIRAEISAITERAMRGEVEFGGALRERVALLRDLDLARIEELLAQRITLTPGARTLVATMRRAGAHTALVSGGFTHFTEVVAERVGFDENAANRLVVAGGRLSGLVEEPILGRAAKQARLEALTAELAIPAAATLAVGDGANDLDMIGAAGLGVAYHAKPAVAAAAGARIDHGDLTALLYLQGYARSEFAPAD